MDRIMWLSRATARLLTQLPTFSVRKLPTSKGYTFLCYRVSLCANMTFRKRSWKGVMLWLVAPTTALRPSTNVLYLQLAASHTWQQENGDEHTGDESAEVVEDADTAIRKAPDKVEAEPEEPVCDGPIPVHTHRAAVDDVEYTKCAENAENGSRRSRGQHCRVNKVGDDTADDAGEQVNHQVAPLAEEYLDRRPDEKQREHIQADMQQVEMQEHCRKDGPGVRRILVNERIILRKLDEVRRLCRVQQVLAE